jgi:hypothetical protein
MIIQYNNFVILIYNNVQKSLLWYWACAKENKVRFCIAMWSTEASKILGQDES